MITQEREFILEDETSREEIVCRLIDNYMDLQRIKIANGNVKNEELEFQIKCTEQKLRALKVFVKDWVCDINSNRRVE